MGAQVLDKHAVVDAMRQALTAAIDAALAGAEAARAEATHAESRAENKYDTRGLEASYLAAGQGERVVAWRAALGSLDATPCGVGGVGALVGLDDGRWVLVAAGGGGIRADVDGVTVGLVTPEAPLGRALLGAEEGDVVEVGARSLEIVSLT